MAHKQASIVDLDDEMDRFSIVAPSTIAEQELFKLPKVPTADGDMKEPHEDGSSEGKAGSLNNTVPKKPTQFDESFVTFLMEQNKRLIKRLPNVASLSKDCVSYSNGRHKPSCDCDEAPFTSLEIPEPPIHGPPGIELYAQPSMPGHHPEMPLPNHGPPIQAPPGIEPSAQPPMPGHQPQLSLPTHGPPIQAPPSIEPYAPPPFSIPGHHPPLPLPAHGPPTQAPSSIEPYSQPPIPIPGHHRPLHLPTQGPPVPAPALPEPQPQIDPYTHLPHPGPPLPVPQDPFEDLENLATERMVYNQGNDVWSALLRLARVVEAASGPATGSDSVLAPYDSVTQQFVPNPFEPNTTERQEFWSRRAQLTSDLRSLERKYGLREEFYAGKKKKAGALAAKCCKDGKGAKKSDAPGFWGLLGEKCSVGRGKGFEEVFGLVRLVVLVVVALQLYAIAGAQKSRGWW